MKPRIAIAGFQHETNTFAPLKTEYADFERGGAWPGITRGAAIFDVFDEPRIPITGFIGAAQEFDLVPLLWAAAEPAGYVTDDAFDRISGEMCTRLADAGEIDGVYLDLHGAMVTENHEDGEGALLAHIREVVGPDLPIAVSLDLHGNLTAEFARLASCVTMYRTYPHIDMPEAGARAAALLAHLLDRGKPFAKTYRQAGFIPPITDQSTMREPGGRLYGMLPGLEGNGVASIDLAFGFPPADIHDCGPSILAYGADQAAVDAAADAMLAALHGAERDFSNPLIPAPDAVRAAMASETGKPVVICDAQDNPGAGAVGDSTGLLAALIEAGATGACLGMLWDPETAAMAHTAGEGAEIDVRIGGKFPEIGGPPIEARVRVETLSDGRFTCTGPMYGGAKSDLGPMACLALNDGAIRVAIGSVRAQNADQAIFRAVGIEPSEHRIVAVKSAVHFLADYEPIAERVIFAAAPGANPCLLTTIPYRNLRKGVRLGPGGPPFGETA